MLAVNLDQEGRDLAEQRGGGGLAVDEAPAAAIGLDLAAHDQRLAGFDLDPRFVQDQRQAAVGGGGLETGGDDRLPRAVADQSAIAAPAQRQPSASSRIDLPAPRLARQDAQATAEIEVQRLDQDDITNGQRGQHGARYKGKRRAMLSPAAKMIPICSGDTCSQRQRSQFLPRPS